MKLKDLMKYFALAIVSCACVSGQLLAADEADDDQEEVATKKKAKKAAAADDEDDEVAPKKKARKAAEADDDDEEEAPKPPAAAQRMVVSVGKFETDIKGGSEDANGNFSGTVDSQQIETLRTRIQNRVVGTRKFEVTERQQLKQLLDELKLADSGVTNEDDAGAPQSGMLKAAVYTLYGSILSWDFLEHDGGGEGVSSKTKTARIELQLKIADVETGKILADKIVTGYGFSKKMTANGGAIGRASTDRAMRDAIDNVAAVAVDTLRDHCYPAKIVRVGKSSVTVNLTQGEVKEGDVFEVVKAAKPIRDPDTGTYLGCDGDEIGRVEITSTGPMTSKAEPIEKPIIKRKRLVKKVELDLEDVAVGYLLRRVSPAKLSQEAIYDRPPVPIF